MPDSKSINVAVLGGGPAGSAAAIALARRGISVVLIEKTRFVQPRIGETLLPAARVPLARLGVWHKFLRDNHKPSPANISAWGEGEITENHFIFNPYGNGWHIDRTRFDTMLALAAEDAGAQVWRGSRLIDWGFEHNKWRIALEGTGEISARFLVDATGRAGAISRGLGAKRNEADRLVGIVASFEQHTTEDNRTLVESAESGWWYSAPLPDQRRVIAYMTDADLLPSSQAAVAEFWHAQLIRTEFSKEYFKGQTPERPLQSFSAQSYLTNPIVGKSWVAIGDGALAFDPLSSQGIYNALESGLRSADCIARYFHGAADAFDDYVIWVHSRYEKFLLKRNWYYNQERRWMSSEFWKRRQRDETDDR